MIISEKLTPLLLTEIIHYGLPRWLSGKESACQAGDVGSVPGLGGSPEERNGNPLQCSCLENPKDRWAWQAMNPWGCKSVGHDLVIKQQLIIANCSFFLLLSITGSSVMNYVWLHLLHNPADIHTPDLLFVMALQFQFNCSVVSLCYPMNWEPLDILI